MTILTAKQYEEQKHAFLHKHDDWQVETSPMDSDGKYHKEYICTDGAIWYEIMRPVYETAEVTVKGVKVSVNVKLFETEGWSSDNAASIFYYEKF